MKILVIGGTGFLGSHLVPKLIQERHEVTVLTRQKHLTSTDSLTNIEYLTGDILNPREFESSILNYDLIILIAMPKITPGERITRKRFIELREQTTLFFQNTINLVRKKDIPVIVTSGASFYTKSGEIADETWPILREGIPKIGENTDRIIEENKSSIIQILPGQIYGNGGMFKTHIVQWILEGKFKIIGSGNNHIPRIHVEDCANGYIQAIRYMPLGEKFILADNDACTVNDFTNYLTDNLHLDRCSHFPTLPVRILKGNLTLKTILMDCKVTNNKAKLKLGWQLKYPTYKEGLLATLEEFGAGPTIV